MDEITKLKTENERLEKLNGIKSELISISAHQLRTSLSAMKWMLKMFMDGDLGKLSTEQESFMKKAFDSNDRMITFVNEMLTINHAEDTELKYNFEKKDITPLIENTVFDFTGESYKKGVELLFLKSEKPLPEISVDGEKFRVVMQNLVENAIKYSNKGDKVFISTKEKDSGIEISVKDIGIGIPEAEQKNIFDKFFRADNAKEKDSIGSGLGLYTTKSIVLHHGGKIWFESSSHGTTFFVTLPEMQ